MKTKIYLRIAQRSRGTFSVSASAKPNYDSLQGNPQRYGRTKALPTLAFGLEIEFPDSLIKQAEQIAAKVNLDSDQAKIFATVLPVPSDNASPVVTERKQ